MTETVTLQDYGQITEFSEECFVLIKYLPTDVWLSFADEFDGVLGNDCGDSGVLDGVVWRDLEIAKKTTRDTAISNGFAVTEQGSVNHDGTKTPRRVAFRCSRGDDNKDSTAKKRKVNTNSNDCPFRCSVNFTDARGEWRLVRQQDNHNHVPHRRARKLSAIKRHCRRESQEGFDVAVKRYMDNSKLSAAHVIKDLKERLGDEIEIEDYDVRNAARLKKHQETGVFTDTQSFVKR